MLDKIQQTITDQPLKFSLRVDAWGILKLLRVKRVPLSIRGARLHTLLKMSPLLAQINVDKETLMPKMGDNIKLQARVAAIGILNDTWKIKLFAGPLSRLLYKNLRPEDMIQLLAVVVDQMNIQDFLSSIVLTGGLQIQRSQTSLESDTGEKIAPGSQSDS